MVFLSARLEMPTSGAGFVHANVGFLQATWENHNTEGTVKPRFLGEASTTSDMQMTLL